MNETVERVRILKRFHDLGVYLIGVDSGADLGEDLENKEKIAREDLASQFPGDTNAAAAWGTKSGAHHPGTSSSSTKHTTSPRTKPAQRSTRPRTTDSPKS